MDYLTEVPKSAADSTCLTIALMCVAYERASASFREPGRLRNRRSLLRRPRVRRCRVRALAM